MITLVPALTPATRPVLLTVATDGVAETQGFVAFAVPEPANWVVNVEQTLSVPVITGNGFTVTVTAVLVELGQPAAVLASA